jgi:hypothetical protein
MEWPFPPSVMMRFVAVMLNLETLPRLEAASRQFFQVLVLVSALKASVLVLVLRVTVSVSVLVLVHTVSLTSRGFVNLTLVSFDNNVKVRRPIRRRAGATAPRLAFHMGRGYWLHLHDWSSAFCPRRSAIVHKLNTSHGVLQTGYE